MTRWVNTLGSSPGASTISTYDVVSLGATLTVSPEGRLTKPTLERYPRVAAFHCQLNLALPPAGISAGSALNQGSSVTGGAKPVRAVESTNAITKNFMPNTLARLARITLHYHISTIAWTENPIAIMGANDENSLDHYLLPRRGEHKRVVTSRWSSF